MGFRQLGKLSSQVLTMTGSNNLVFRLSRASLHLQSNALYADSHRPSKKPLTARDIEQLSTQLPHFVFLLVRWWYKIRPLKVEIADLHRRLQRNKEGFETKIHSQTRYFVRFPFLTDEEFSNWVVSTDSSSNQGYSWAEFVRSSRSAPGCAKALGMNESVYPEGINSKTQTISSFDDANKDHSFGYTHPVVYPKLSFRPASKQATCDAVVTTSTDPCLKVMDIFVVLLVHVYLNVVILFVLVLQVLQVQRVDFLDLYYLMGFKLIHIW
uniref:Uncharacterized protein n=1 Tax=Trichobilharzia regenti TaxID=157069 RepID=A0AA85IT02_TRIRE|nr:unnamed protein product [Trichobilharzia regenti]